jgi:N-acetylglucosaminyldiphosphoundecaprenol N-acetyl-beta-D-mannosaminyltransferase
MGVGFDPLSEPEVVDHILTAIGAGRGGWVVTPNTDIVRQATADSALHQLVSSADLVVPDGMPVVWASRLQGTPLPERVAGATLITTLSRAAARQSVPIFLLGGAEGVAQRAAATLCAQIPGVLTGYNSPPFGFESDPVALRAIDAAVASFGPAIYFCGFGFPKQERLIVDLISRHVGSWFIGAGASIAFLGGDAQRAPLWMQQTGLEWLHRLRCEPRRLFRRYLADAPFAMRMTSSAVAAGVRGRIVSKAPDVSKYVPAAE